MLRILIFILSFVATSTFATELPHIPISKLNAQLDKTISIVFDDESEELYGDLLSHRLHIDKVCEVIKALENNPPRSIFIDMDITENPLAAGCIAAAARKIGVKITADFDPHLVSAATKDDLKDVSVGTAQVNALVIGENPRGNYEQSPWLAPETRVALVKPAVLPYSMPAYFLNLVNGLDEDDLRKIDITWNRNITLAEFYETAPKISIQEVLQGNTSTLKDKYVLIGVDQDKYDSLSNSRGEVINGVFLHQHYTAAYLALMEGSIEVPPSPMIIFGEPVVL